MFVALLVHLLLYAWGEDLSGNVSFEENVGIPILLQQFIARTYFPFPSIFYQSNEALVTQVDVVGALHFPMGFLMCKLQC